MIFKVERSSDLGNIAKPIKEAYKGKCIETERSLFRTFEEYEKIVGVSVKAKGMNHRINKNNRIVRDFEIECYLIEIKTLEDLMKLEMKYGDIIIRHSNYNYPILEIYDDWRE